MSPPIAGAIPNASAPPPLTDLRLELPAEGRITQFVLTLQADMVACLQPALRSLFSQLLPDTAVLLISHNRAANAAEALLQEAATPGSTTSHQLALVADDVPLSLWAQDCLHPARDKTGRCLLLGQEATDDHVLLFERVAEALALPAHRLAGLPDGGNMLAGPGVLLVGADAVADPAALQLVQSLEQAGANRQVFPVGSRLPVPTEQERPRRLNGQEWREIACKGNRPGTRQPVFHIDLFLSAAGRAPDGRGRLLVGDPHLAAQILNQPPPPRALSAPFDDIAGQLAEAGFEVHRNPLPLVYCDLPDRRTRHWYFASSNNVIVQDDAAAGRIVWLPCYGHGNWPELAATDQANAELWRTLGFDVRQVENCQPLAENFGGLNCLVKVLQRR